MTKDEAMKLALEALDSCEFDYDNEERQVRTFDALLVNKAHRALHQALEQPKPYDQTALELCDVCGWKTLIPDDGCLNCGLGKVEQLPVAWINEGALKLDHIIKTPIQICRREPDEHYNVPLYTAPPKRGWVWLTDEEVSQIENEYTAYRQIPEGSVREFARAIEKRLKEKNK